MRFIASVAVSLALGTSVSAQTTAATSDQPAVQAPPVQTSPGATEAADKKKDGVICRRETPTGSLFLIKVCTTPEQRKAESASAHRARDSMQGAAPTIPN